MVHYLFSWLCFRVSVRVKVRFRVRDRGQNSALQLSNAVRQSKKDATVLHQQQWSFEILMDFSFLIKCFFCDTLTSWTCCCATEKHLSDLWLGIRLKLGIRLGIGLGFIKKRDKILYHKKIFVMIIFCKCKIFIMKNYCHTKILPQKWRRGRWGEEKREEEIVELDLGSDVPSSNLAVRPWPQEAFTKRA